MNNHILDDEAIVKNSRKPKASPSNWTAILILWLCIAHLLVLGLFTDIQVQGAIVALVIASVVTYYDYEKGVKITMAIILLGFISILDFSLYSLIFTFTLTIGRAVFDIEFDMLLFLIGLIHYFTNREFLSVFFKQIIGPKPSERELEQNERKQVERYKKALARKDFSELRILSKDETLLLYARKAAKELLEEKELLSNDDIAN